MDTIMKTLYGGLGALNLTKEKAEEIIDDLVMREEMSANDKKAMVEKLLLEAKKQKDDLEGKVFVSVQKVLTDIGLPTQQDIKSISRRLDAIEKAVGSMKRGKRGSNA